MGLQGRITVGQGPLESLSDDIVDEAADLFERFGALSLDGAFDTELVRRLRSAFEREYAYLPIAEIARTCLFVGDNRYMFTVRLIEPFLDPAVYASPVVLPIVHRLLGTDAIIQSFGAVCAFPGSAQQHIHRDFPQLFSEIDGLGTMLPPYVITVVIPLQDPDVATGTTAMWEGSHRQALGKAEGRERVPNPGDDSADLAGSTTPHPKLGDCYLMDLRLRHGGTPNRSNRPRSLLYIVYSRPWFRDNQNFDIQHPVLISQADLDAIPDTYRPLFAAVAGE